MTHLALEFFKSHLQTAKNCLGARIGQLKHPQLIAITVFNGIMIETDRAHKTLIGRQNLSVKKITNEILLKKHDCLLRAQLMAANICNRKNCLLTDSCLGANVGSLLSPDRASEFVN